MTSVMLVVLALEKRVERRRGWKPRLAVGRATVGSEEVRTADEWGGGSRGRGPVEAKRIARRKT